MHFLWKQGIVQKSYNIQTRELPHESGKWKIRVHAVGGEDVHDEER